MKPASGTVTEKDVLDVAEELHAYIKDNKESQGENEDNSSKMLAPDMDSGEDTAEQEGKMIYSGMQFSDDEGDTEESEEESTESSNSSESDGQEEETETTEPEFNAEEFYGDGLASVLEEVGIDPQEISNRFQETGEINEDD